MPWELHQATLIVHILLAIMWVGGILFIGWGVYPAVRNMNVVTQREILLRLMQWSHKYLTGAGAGVILTGILLGTVFGPISQWYDVIDTRYGNIWLTALIVGTLTLLWGVFVGYRQFCNVFSNVELWEQADSGDRKPLFKALINVALLESVEVAGFMTLLYLMVLL
ncbi:hypothetical protein GCM10007063_27090 [Lentibacillus kapialis]|uniref:Copper resistance protein D domain-containing protein n=1 Tax=Lentibacillus kapialis TaxID=340214 RepID=A0A917V019_9BACI|nr:hypothetical protein [Lentibacillus kapialis]GGK03462.1 hypothetical protein GCM10007063_27090 [Lentibacillus kapialis]